MPQSEAAEYARRVAEMVEEDEEDAEDEEDEEDEAEAFLRQRVLDMLLRRAGCPQERREQLTQGGEPWTQLARSEWWDRVSAAGFFLHDRDPSMSGGSWHDVGDGLSWVDAWGCASAHREEVNGELGRFRFEFWSWRTARGLEPVAEEAEPRRRASAGARARARPRPGGGRRVSRRPGCGRVSRAHPPRCEL